MTLFENTCKSLKSCKFTGCDILRFIDLTIQYSIAVRETIEYSVRLLHEVSIRLSYDHVKAEFACFQFDMIAKEAPPILPFPEPLKEKKPKYIRQQHKLAQRHYRRK